MTISVVGVELSKSVFQLSMADAGHRVVHRKRLSRAQFHRYLAQTTRVRLVMEACGTTFGNDAATAPGRGDDTFPVGDFRWDGEADEYRCPAGKPLLSRRRNFKKPRTVITKANTIIYRSSEADCKPCPLKPRCCPNTPRREIDRSIYGDARDVARHIANTTEYHQSRRERKKVEMLFAHLKRILKLGRLRLRGLSGARDEFLLAATAQNLRRMAKLMSQPPPYRNIGAPA